MRTIKLIFIILAISSQWGCLAQNALKTDTMQHIDLTKTYLEIKKQYNLPDGEFNRFYLSDSTKLQMYTTGDNNQNLQLTEYLSNGYEYIYIYRKINGFKIGGYGKSFQDQSIGIWSFFDKNGILKKEVNQDEGYSFSMQQVIDKLKKEYNEDLHDRSRVYSVWRFIDTQYLHKPLYIIDYFLKPIQDQQYGDDFLVNGYLIDATTGETIFTHQYNRWDEYGYNAYDAYLIELGFKSKDDFGPQDLSKLPPPLFIQ